MSTTKFDEAIVKRYEDRIWDFSTIDLYMTCRRKFYWRMVRDLAPKRVAVALDFGKVVHGALEFYYKGGTASDAIAYFATNFKDVEGEELRTVENGIKMLGEYFKLHPTEPFKVIDTEVGFAVPVMAEQPNCINCLTPFMEDIGRCSVCNFPRSFMYGGRIDMLVEWDGQVFVYENKTTAALGASYPKQYDLNMQLDGYTYAATRHIGKKCQGVIVNVLEPWKEVKRVTEKTKRPEDHFARLPFSRSEDDLKHFALAINQIIRDIMLDEVRNEYYQNKRSCFNYKSECAYKGLCLYGEDPRFIERDFMVEKWEPYKEEKADGTS